MARVGLHPREHLDLLYQASLEFNSTLDTSELLPRVFDRVLELLDAEAGSIWLLRGEVLVCEIARGPVGEEIEGLELPVGAGIVGDVARRGESELVANAQDDPRFVHQVDEATGFATRSMLAAPLRARDETLGVLQILNKRSAGGRFDESDRALLEGLAATAGLALRNAQLHEVERRARDLRALLAISREIGSTLDLDRLALSIVNLGSQALAYDRAAIALYETGRPVLKAVSGQERIDGRSDEMRELERLILWLAERDALVYLPDVAGDHESAAALRRAFGPYLERTGIRSLCCIPLKDEEGRLGAFYMESARADFLGTAGREAAELLANQASVAIRNAELYGQVPFIGLLEPVAAARRRLAAMPRSRLIRRVLAPAAAVLLLLLIPWGERIGPRDARLLPDDRMPVRATVPGLIAELNVAEGEEVERGDVLATLRDDRLLMEAQEARADLERVERDAAAARAGGDGTAERVARIRIEALRARLALIDARLERSRVRAPVSGAVLTLRPHERVGRWLEAGDTLVLLGRTDRLELEARVTQRDIERVRPGQSVRLKIPARPDYTFVGRVTEVSSYAEPGPNGDPLFIVRAELDNGRGLLRPGMEARAKIVGSLRPIGYHLARPFIEWAQLRFWR